MRGTLPSVVIFIGLHAQASLPSGPLYLTLPGPVSITVLQELTVITTNFALVPHVRCLQIIKLSLSNFFVFTQVHTHYCDQRRG